MNPGGGKVVVFVVGVEPASVLTGEPRCGVPNVSSDDCDGDCPTAQ